MNARKILSWTLPALLASTLLPSVASAWLRAGPHQELQGYVVADGANRYLQVDPGSRRAVTVTLSSEGKIQEKIDHIFVDDGYHRSNHYRGIPKTILRGNLTQEGSIWKLEVEAVFRAKEEHVVAVLSRWNRGPISPSYRSKASVFLPTPAFHQENRQAYKTLLRSGSLFPLARSAVEVTLQKGTNHNQVRQKWKMDFLHRGAQEDSAEVLAAFQTLDQNKGLELLARQAVRAVRTYK